MFDEHTVADFWDRVEVRTPSECWEWKAGKTKGAYGSVRIAGRNFRAHRIALAIVTEDMPAGMHALHGCDNPPCCNPHHLRWGKDIDNVADRQARGRDRGFGRVNREKTHCVKGHELSGENLKLRPDGERNCRTCAHVSHRKWVEKTSATKSAALIEGRSA